MPAFFDCAGDAAGVSASAAAAASNGRSVFIETSGTGCDYYTTMKNERRLADGRVELIDTGRVEASPLYNDDLAPVPLAPAQLDHLQLRRAVDQHGALHPDLHAGVGPDRRRA